MGKSTRMETMCTLRLKKFKALGKFLEFYPTSSKITQVCLFWKFNGNFRREKRLILFYFCRYCFPYDLPEKYKKYLEIFSLSEVFLSEVITVLFID